MVRVEDADKARDTQPYDAVGRVTAEGVLLEHSLRFLIVAIEFTLTLANYANAASLNQLIDLSRVALDSQRSLSQAQRTEIAEIIERADKLRIARNEIVHSLWRPEAGDQDNPVVSFAGYKPARRKIGMRELPSRTIEEMRTIAAEIFALRDDMFAVTYNLLISRANADTAPLERHERIANPHGPTPDGRSVTPHEADVDDDGPAPASYM